MLGGVAMLTLNDAGAKLLLERYDPAQVAFMRGVLALPPLVLLALLREGRAGLRSHCVSIHALRGLLIFCATLVFFGSLRFLPLAEASSLLFTAPIMVVVIAAVFLGERVDRARWGSVLLGFVGVLIVVRPGMAAFQPASLLALAGAALYALVMLSAERIDPRDGLWTMALYMTGFSTLFASVGLFAEWPTMRGADGALFCGMAVCGTLGAAFITQAFRLAPATLVAPLDYTALLWASLFGWAVWGHVPDGAVYLGAAVIVVGGIVLLRAEARSG